MNKIRTRLSAAIRTVGKGLLTALKAIRKGCAVFFHAVPKWFWAFPILAVISGVLHLICSLSTSFADWMIETLCAPVRFGLAKMTGWIPFSLGEMILLLLPVIVILLILLTVRLARHFNAKLYCRTVAGLLSVICMLYSLFVWTLAPGYQCSTLDQKLGLARVPVSADELLSTAEILRDKVHATLDSITFRYGDFSVMPYSLDEMNEKLNDAYEAAGEKYHFLSNFRSKVKYVMLSEPMSYTHITGVYSYYTGEANLNIHFPDYSLPYTAAHELAHQRGIARENEANFVAFLVCLESDDPYIQYSGYVNLLEYVMNSLYSASPDLYTEFYSTLEREVVYEFYASSAFFDQYRENVAADVSSAVNNNYLQSQGQTAGIQSYGLVVDLAVAYYKAATTE